MKFDGISTMQNFLQKPLRDHYFSTYACTCAYQGVRNVSFSENFAYVPNE